MQENRSLGFTTRHVQLQNQARCLRFLILEEEGLYNPCSKNKGTDQLCSYCTTDLRLCFCIGKKFGFHRMQLIVRHCQQSEYGIMLS